MVREVLYSEYLKIIRNPHQDSGLEGITSHLSRHEAGPEAIDLYREIRQKCELARFAGTLQPDATLYDKAVRLIGLLDP